MFDLKCPENQEIKKFWPKVDLVSDIGVFRVNVSMVCVPRITSRKHLRAKVTPDFHLTYSKNWGNLGVRIKMIKMNNFQYFSIKSYVVDVY